jgi:Flp pilus assembly protein TadG
MRSSAASDRADRGQAVVELALALPLVFMLLLGMVQLGLVVRDQLLVTHAAREAARAASVSASPAVAAARATAGSPLRQMSVGTSASGTSVTVEVTAISITDVPLVGALLPDVRVSARVTMAREPP